MCIYGMAGLKTHSKIALVVRQEEDGIRRYVHLGTGNYNDVTAKIYTDHGFLTTDPTLCDDASAFFNMLTGLSQPAQAEEADLCAEPPAQGTVAAHRPRSGKRPRRAARPKFSPR